MKDTTSATPTASVCDSMALFGASPERGELDSRIVWDEDDAIDALSEAIRVMVDGITVDGTQMSYNAALRFDALGYENLYWYRGGIAAWKAANLPTRMASR